MKWRTIQMKLILASVILLMVLPTPAPAQPSNDETTLIEALAKTDEVIAIAQEIVMESVSQKARISLGRAKGLQNQARNQFDSANRVFRSVLQLTLGARQEAWHAIGMARSDTKTAGQLARTAEETYNRLLKLRGMLIDSGVKDRLINRLMDESRSLLEKAQINAHQLRLQLALKLAQNARTLSIQADGRFRNIRNLKILAERRVELLERLIERSRERVAEHGNEQATRRLVMAGEQLEKAKDLLREGRYHAARLALEKCEKILRNLIRQIPSKNTSDPGRLLDEINRLLERTEEIVSRRGDIDPKAMELIKQGKRLMRMAEEEIAEGRIEEARRLIAEARKLFRRAAEVDKDGLNGEKVSSEIERIENYRNELGPIIENCTAPGAATLMDRGDDHLAKARKHLEDDKLRMATAEAHIARNLYNRVREACTN